MAGGRATHHVCYTSHAAPPVLPTSWAAPSLTPLLQLLPPARRTSRGPCVYRCAPRQVLQEHGKQLHAVLRAWDSESSEVASREAFHRSAQAVGALGLTSRIPSTVELDSMFDVIAAGKETIAITELLKQIKFLFSDRDTDLAGIGFLSFGFLSLGFLLLMLLFVLLGFLSLGFLSFFQLF